jgi:hypothetical protein
MYIRYLILVLFTQVRGTLIMVSEITVVLNDLPVFAGASEFEGLANNRWNFLFAYH